MGNSRTANKTLVTILKHTGWWLLFFTMAEIGLFINCFVDFNKTNILLFLETFFALCPMIPTFYITKDFLYPKLIIRKKYFTFLVCAALLFFIDSGLRFYIEQILNKYLLSDLDAKIKFLNRLFEFYGNYIGFMTMFIGFCYLLDFYKKSKMLTVQNAQLIEQQKEIAMLSAAKAKSEIALLKNQINPHFLYNTLNMLYSKATLYSEELADGIATLSGMMRYALTSNKNNLVPLEDEVQHIEDVIKINKLRFEDNMFLTFTKRGNMDNIYIEPLILLTLVENVFKHGAVHLREFPATMDLLVEGTVIQFKTYNKKKKGIKEPGTGIGINNIAVRLEHNYSGKYDLQIEQTEEFYSSVLKIDTA